MSLDILLVESGNGGDFVLNSSRRDLETVRGFQNMIYLALFGGNIEQSTKTYRAGELRFDWWGNSLIPELEIAKMNSRTERLVRSSSLTSQSRLEIEQSVLQDLSFMKEFATLEVTVVFPNIDRVEIRIELNELTSQESEQYTFLWDVTGEELAVNNPYTTL
jgi:phage gp46-like protein